MTEFSYAMQHYHSGDFDPKGDVFVPHLTLKEALGHVEADAKERIETGEANADTIMTVRYEEHTLIVAITISNRAIVRLATSPHHLSEVLDLVENIRSHALYAAEPEPSNLHNYSDLAKRIDRSDDRYNELVKRFENLERRIEAQYAASQLFDITASRPQ